MVDRLDEPHEVDSGDRSHEEPTILRDDQDWFDRLITWGRDLRPWVKGTVAFAIFLALALAIWARPILGRFDTRAMGDGGGDAKFYQWSLSWVRWSLMHRTDPLFTHEVFAPDGTSLVWTTFVPAAGLLLLPVSALFGALVALNTGLVLASALACWAAYLVCFRLTRAYWPSVVGGYLFGYSAYMVGHMHGHLNLVFIFPVPLAVYLVIRRTEGSMGRPTFLILLSLTLVTLFLSSTELFATTAFFGVVAFTIAAIAARRDRGRVLASAALTAGAYLITAVVMSPYLIAAVRQPPPKALHDLRATSVDLYSFVVPRIEELHRTDAANRISDRFLAKGVEDAGYVSLALIVMLVWFAISERRRRGTWGLLAFVGIVSLAALGPVLHLMGRESVWLPWSLLATVPLIKEAPPDRFPAYSALAIGVIAALWLARAPNTTAPLRWGVVAVGIFLLYPNVHFIGHKEQTLPAFFEDGTYRSVLQQDEVVLAIPESRGEEMLWQESTDMWFRLVVGYLGPVPGPYANDPMRKGLSGDLGGSTPLPPPEIPGWLNAHQVTSIVIADGARADYETLLRSIGGRVVHDGGGVSVWRPESGTWSFQPEG